MSSSSSSSSSSPAILILMLLAVGVVAFLLINDDDSTSAPITLPPVVAVNTIVNRDCTYGNFFPSQPDCLNEGQKGYQTSTSYVATAQSGSGKPCAEIFRAEFLDSPTTTYERDPITNAVTRKKECTQDCEIDDSQPFSNNCFLEGNRELLNPACRLSNGENVKKHKRLSIVKPSVGGGVTCDSVLATMGYSNAEMESGGSQYVLKEACDLPSYTGLNVCETEETLNNGVNVQDCITSLDEIADDTRSSQTCSNQPFVFSEGAHCIKKNADISTAYPASSCGMIAPYEEFKKFAIGDQSHGLTAPQQLLIESSPTLLDKFKKAHSTELDTQMCPADACQARAPMNPLFVKFEGDSNQGNMIWAPGKGFFDGTVPYYGDLHFEDKNFDQVALRNGASRGLVCKKPKNNLSNTCKKCFNEGSTIDCDACTGSDECINVLGNNITDISGFKGDVSSLKVVSEDLEGQGYMKLINSSVGESSFDNHIPHYMAINTADSLDWRGNKIKKISFPHNEKQPLGIKYNLFLSSKEKNDDYSKNIDEIEYRQITNTGETLDLGDSAFGRVRNNVKSFKVEGVSNVTKHHNSTAFFPYWYQPKDTVFNGTSLDWHA